jgi:hypothetical protein
VKANFHYWGELIELARRCPRWSDKVRVFLKPPGWRPAELGGFQGPRAKDRATYRKFDTPVAKEVRGYVAVQFTLLLVVTTLFLFKQELLSPWLQAGAALLIIWWVMDMGLLMEAHRRAVMLESGRILAFALLGIGLSVALWVSWPLVTVAFCAVSLLHLAFLASTGSLPW